MKLTRRFILGLLHARNLNPKVTPKSKNFVALAEELVLEHDGLVKDDLPPKSYDKFHKEMVDFKAKASRYMGGGSLKKLIKNPHRQVILGLHFRFFIV